MLSSDKYDIPKNLIASFPVPINRSAYTLRKPIIAKRRRISTRFYYHLVHSFVNLICILNDILNDANIKQFQFPTTRKQFELLPYCGKNEAGGQISGSNISTLKQ
ncbi:hypothetical protein V6Z11_D05G300200 [Gossypium hirsutum]